MLGVIGGLAQKFLPDVIEWGAKKLSNTNFGAGVGNKVTKLK